MEVRPDLGVRERRPESPETAGPDSVSIASQIVCPLAAYPHVATPTLDTTDEQELEIVDVGSGPDYIDLSYHTLLTSDVEPHWVCPRQRPTFH